MLASAVRVVGDFPPHGTMRQREVIASGFLASLKSETYPQRHYSYVVTTAHTLKNQPNTEIEIQSPSGDLYPRMRVTDWRQPLDGVDIAVAPFEKHPSTRFVDIHESLVPSERFGGLPLGADIFYIGILTTHDVAMARKATIGALDVLNIHGFPVHLLDCRSYGGFSGSACWVRVGYPVLIPCDHPELHESERAAPIGYVAYRVFLAGMFKAHLTTTDDDEDGAVNRYGVASMIRGQEIRDALMSDELKQDRKKKDQENPPDPPPEFTDASRSEPHDMDERVKIDMEPEDALKKLLGTPPVKPPEK